MPPATSAPDQEPVANDSAYLHVAVESPALTEAEQNENELEKVLTPEVQYITPTTDADPQPTAAVYISVLLVLIQSFQYGWYTGQVNFKTYHNKITCAARPIAPGTCIMFPGHTMTQWTVLANAWVVGGMCGTLLVAKPSDRFGRRRTLWCNGIIMMAGGILQMTAYNVWHFAAGRFVGGIASGFATGIIGGYIAEISPPKLRSTFGTGFHAVLSVGLLCVAISFFFVDTSDNWRYAAAVPIVIGATFMVLAPCFMVESPVWLLAKGRNAEAEKEIARMYGEKNVPLVVARLQAHHTKVETVPFMTVFKPEYRFQLLIACAVAHFHQFCGINAVLFYSSSIFSTSGISDPRIGTLIVDLVNCLPTLVLGVFAKRLKTRTMLLVGTSIMLVCAIVMTISLVKEIGAVSVAFTAIYVGGFGISYGPLVWSVTAELFPAEIRSRAVSLAMMSMWLSKITVGIGYPYMHEALDNYSFIPFIGTLTFALTFLYFLMPDTHNKSIDEIEELFRQRREKKAKK